MLKDALWPAQAAIRTDLGAIFVSMELSRRAWLITSLSPGAGEKMSKHSVPASDVCGLLHRFAELRRKAAARTGRDFPIIVIQEAGLDGFWIHRVLQSEEIESHVVDPASILTSRRGRRAKTDRIDGETLVRHPDGVQAWRAAGMFDGQGADAAGGGLPGASAASALAERLDRSRAGCVQGGQPAAADNNGRAGLVMAAEPADLDAQPVVPRAGSAPWRASAQDDHCRPGGASSSSPCGGTRPLASSSRGP